MIGIVGKLSAKLMLTVLTNFTLDVYMWTCTIWMTLFAASRKLRGGCEQIFINQLNFRPTSLGKHNSMGHLLPCAIDFKTNHPPIHLQWIGILGMATEPRHVISMGPRQPEVPGEAILSATTSSVWRTLWQHVQSVIQKAKSVDKNILGRWLKVETASQTYKSIHNKQR